MRALVGAVVISASLAAASAASAGPIVYEFSGVYDPYAEQDSLYQQLYLAPNYQSSRFPDLSSCATCPAFSGRLSYDSDLGVMELDLTSAITYSAPIFDLGGVAPTPGATVSSDRLDEGSYYGNGLFGGYSGGYFAADNNENFVGYGYQDPFDFTGLALNAPGLISEGQLRSGLTISDFTWARIYRWWGSVTGLHPTGTCPPGQLLQCAQSGDYDVTLDWHTADFQILEIHQVPEPAAGRLTVIGLLGLFIARSMQQRRSSTRPR